MEPVKTVFSTNDILVKASDAAKILGVSIGTLSQWRHSHRYSLKYVLAGTGIRYRLSDIEKFIETQTVDGKRAPREGLKHRRGGPGCRGLAHAEKIKKTRLARQ